MAKPNYSFAKRQRELEKKQKKEEKRKQKVETKEATPQDELAESAADVPGGEVAQDKPAANQDS